MTSKLTITACNVRLSDRYDLCDVAVEVSRVGGTVILGKDLEIVCEGILVDDLTKGEIRESYKALYACWEEITRGTIG